MTDRYDFDAYGISVGFVANTQSATTTALLYSGEQFDTGLQMYNLRARYYDPHVGRFVSRDPSAPDLRLPETLFPYAFANDNPQLYSDPTGMFTLMEMNFVSSIQSGLNSSEGISLQVIQSKIKNEIINYLETSAKNTLKDVVWSSIKSMIPDFGNLQNWSFTAGDWFQYDGTQKLICSYVPFKDILYIAPSILEDGTPVNDGVNCQFHKTYNREMISAGASRPDIVLGNYRPTDDAVGGFGRSFIIGDFKLQPSTVLNSVKSNPQQFNAMTNYARRYGYRMAIYITLTSTTDADLLKELRDIVGKAATQNGTYLLMLQLLGNGGDETSDF